MLRAAAELGPPGLAIEVASICEFPLYDGDLEAEQGIPEPVRAVNDFLHNTSTVISQNHAPIVLEDLSVKSMSKSARGTVEKPGRNVRAKSGLNRSILDQGWGELRRQLEYKQTRRGGMVIAIDPRNTSGRCHSCGHVAAQNRKTQAAFLCVQCGHAADADVNVARPTAERELHGREIAATVPASPRSRSTSRASGTW